MIIGVIFWRRDVRLFLSLQMLVPRKRDGLSLANSLGFGCNSVEAESDSMEVINFCTGSTQWWDSAAAIYAELLDITSLIGKVKFKHCNRKVNGVAHELAKHSYLNKLSCSWTEDLAVWMIPGLANDVIAS